MTRSTQIRDIYRPLDDDEFPDIGCIPEIAPGTGAGFGPASHQLRQPARHSGHPELKKRPQWVAWRYATRKKANGETYQTKPPVNPHTNSDAKANDPSTWGSYEEAVSAHCATAMPASATCSPPIDDISGHDLDKVIDPVTGKLPDWVQEIIDLGETYTEISPSGRGIRMFWRGKLPSAIKFDAAQVEIYSTGRYLTVTGNRIAGTSDEIGPAPKTLELLRARVEQFKAEAAAAKAKGSDAAQATANRPPRTSRQTGIRQAGRSPFWRNLKDAALADLGAWVPNLFGPAAVYQPGTGAYRISSATLGRNLEEDLSIAPDGIQDFGTEQGLTAIDLVMMRNGGTDKEAAFWLCDRMRRTPESLGWNANNDSDILLPFVPPPGAGAPQAPPALPVSKARKELQRAIRAFMKEVLSKYELWQDLQKRVDEHEEAAETAAQAFVAGMVGNPADIKALERVCKAEIQEAYRAHVKAEMEAQGADFTPPQHAIAGTTGIGKSDIARKEVATFYIPEAKRLGLPHRILKLVGTHALADEASKKMPNGVVSMVWQGRDSIKLGTTDVRMCLNLPAVNAAIAIGEEVETTACHRRGRKGSPDMFCPFYDICEYQKQKLAAAKADFVYAAHEIGFSLPEALDDFAMVMIDEAFWTKGLRGTLPKSPRLIIASLADDLKNAPVRDKNGYPLIDETDDLRGLYDRLQAALAQMPDGYVTRQALIDAGLGKPASIFDRHPCDAAAELEWARKNIKSGLHPGAKQEALDKAVAKYGALKRVPKRAFMWKALGELVTGTADATGRVLIETVPTDDGPQRVLRVMRRKDMASRLLELPILVLDATLPLGLVQHYLPELKLACDLKVEAPYMHITQVAAHGLGKSALKPLKPGERTPEEEERAGRKRKTLARMCRHLTQGTRSALAITYLSVEPDIVDGVEPSVETAHFGNFEGVDRWGNVDVLITIGRPLPSPTAIQYMAAAITGRPVLVGKKIDQLSPIGTTGLALKTWTYADPDADMIRAAVAEAAILQAIGRARGVNRTASQPGRDLRDPGRPRGSRPQGR